ncbi:retropepsin-like aspartic protease family protein [Thiolapillus sp.]
MVRLAAVMLLCLWQAAWAVERVRVMALFPGKAMLSIDGRNRMLVRGETSPEGVKLISADADQAVVEYGGQRQSLRLGSAVASSYKRKTRLEARVLLDNQGAYSTQGMINGRSVAMVVDTGANLVAMSENQARRLSLDYARQGEKTLVSTASGRARAWSVRLDRVKIGEIEKRNVAAVVIEGSMPEKVLLGMSFLSGLQVRHQGNLMLLSKSQ